MKSTSKLHELGQSLWLDNITREMLDDGTLQNYRDKLSVTGLTSNPTIFDLAIRHTQAYDDAIARRSKKGQSREALFFELALEDLRRAAALFTPIHEKTGGMDGWVSLEVSPLLAHDTEGTVAEVKRLRNLAQCPNMFIKIPGTAAGVHAIEESIFAGVPVNVTLLFSRDQYVAAANAYWRGIARRIEAGLNPEVHSVASIFISRWDKAVLGKVPLELANRLGIAIAQRTYKTYLERFTTPEWLKLHNAGAAPQRLLWASTGVKDPALPASYYIEALAAPDTINTIPEKTLLAFDEHGALHGAMPEDGGDAEAVLAEFAKIGIDTTELAARLQSEGADAFSKSWADLMTAITEKSDPSCKSAKP
jgi:transaldolase